jgi:hypothetical protein
MEAARLRIALYGNSHIKFAFAGLMIASAPANYSATMFGIGLAFYQSAAVNALLAGCLMFSDRMRRGLAKFYMLALLIPELGLFWTAYERTRSSVLPHWNSIIIAGSSAAAMNIAEACTLARALTSGRPLGFVVTRTLRTTMPYSVAAILAGLGTAATRSGLLDLIVGFAIAAYHFRAPELFERVSRIDVAATARKSDVLDKLVGDFPPLFILLTPAWQQAAAGLRWRNKNHGPP